MRKNKVLSIVLANIIALNLFNGIAAAGSGEPAIDISQIESIDTLSGNTILNVRELDHTESSVDITWDTIDTAAHYSVICNDVVIAEELSDTVYTISDLESAKEYSITIKAYNETDEIISISDELLVYTNLTINADASLMEDLTVADLIISSGTLDLNGHNIYVKGDAFLSSTLNVNKGELYVSGDLNLSSTSKGYSDGYLTMQHDEDYICVDGDMLVYSKCNYNILTAGTIELKGDFTQKYYKSYYANMSSHWRLQLRVMSALI